jgi:hypothetical protein
MSISRGESWCGVEVPMAVLLRSVNPRLSGPAKVGPGGALEHFQLTEKFAFLLAPQRRICGF